MKLLAVVALSLCSIACATEEPLAAPVAKPVPTKPPEAGQAESTVHLLAANAGCTKVRCPQSIPCCDHCRYAWVAAGADVGAAPLKLGGIAVPPPMQKGCNVDFELEVKGRYERDSFVVASFRKVPPRELDAKAAEPLPSLGSTLLTIHAVAGGGSCTTMGCSPSNPCCNRCQWIGWRLKGADPDVYLKLSGIEVPRPEQKDCSVAFDLELTGRSDGNHFVVESFKKLRPGKR